jgi:hypothetical protein
MWRRLGCQHAQQLVQVIILLLLPPCCCLACLLGGGWAALAHPAGHGLLRLLLRRR